MVSPAIWVLLCGVWHGSGWTFVLWGALHGLGLCGHRLWRLWRGRRVHSLLSAGLAWAWATLFTGLCWIPFRAESLHHTRRIVAAMLGAGGPVHWVHPFVWAALALTALAHGLRGLGCEDLLALHGRPWYAPAVLLTLVWLSLLFAAEGFTPFLYARF